MTNTLQYPALEKIGRNGLPLDNTPIYLGFNELAAKWGITPSAVRTYLAKNIGFGEWRYLPKPDAWLVRDDDSALPEWLPETIDNFERLESIQGRGNHTRGETRAGYRHGAHTLAYRHTLGVANAEKMREEYSERRVQLEPADDIVNDFARRYQMRTDEVDDVLAGRRWLPGSGKSRGARVEVKPRQPRPRMSPAYKTLGITKANKIRQLMADLGDAEAVAALYEITVPELEQVLAGVRWVSAKDKRSA